GVQHHERQPPVALQRVLQMERDDRLLLPIFQRAHCRVLPRLAFSLLTRTIITGSVTGGHALGIAESPIRPSVFVGSSSEGVAFAHAVRAGLERDAEITVWDEGVFELGQTFIESLSAALSR